jgi:hypothetical protein
LRGLAIESRRLIPGGITALARRLRSSFGRFAPTEILIVGATVLSLAGWIVVYQWYSLSDHISIPDFAFDKIPGYFDSPILRYTTLNFLVICLLYQAIYWMLRRAGTASRTMKVAIVCLVAGTAVVNIFLYPVGALDVLGYVTELKLKYHYGLNPYVHTFEHFGADPLFKYAFYPELPLFYGPVWLVLSGIATWPVGFTDMLSVTIALKVFNLVLLAATGWAVYAYQEDQGRGWVSAYLFLANPWVLFEGVANGHNDVMVALLLVLAVLALKRRWLLSVAFLVASALVKYFTVVLFPLFLLEMHLRRWSIRRITVSVMLGILTLVAFVSPFWAGGRMLREVLFILAVQGRAMESWSVFSLVQQYLGEKGFSTALFPLVHQFCFCMFVVLAAVLLWGLGRGARFQRALVITYLVFSAFVTHLFSWYLVPAAAVLALEPDMESVVLLFTLSTANLVLYPVSVWAWFNSGLSSSGVHLFQAVFLLLPILAFLTLEFTRTGLVIARHGLTARDPAASRRPR